MNNNISEKMKNRTSLTFQQKADLAVKLRNEPIKNQRALAAKYKISVGLINKILHFDCDKVMAVNMLHRKREICLRKTKDIEPILYRWFQYQRKRNISITGDIMKSKALDIAKQLDIKDFKGSNGWLNSFLKRHDINSKKICGEASTVSSDLITNFRDSYESKLKEYPEKDVFNCDETALFYKQSSSQTYICSDEDKANGKFSKDRITILLCTSMLGEKTKPLVIGKSKNPHCFKRIDKGKLPVYYYSNMKSWMTLNIFAEWLQKLNAEMKLKGRKILLLLDNAPVHSKEPSLSNVELFFLPPNTSSLIQPLDQGIIKSCKDNYKRHLMDLVSLEIDNNENLTQEDLLKKINCYDAIVWIAKSWENVTVDCIKNCFRKSLENAKVEMIFKYSEEFDNEKNKLFPAYNTSISVYELDSIIEQHVEEQYESNCESSDDTDNINVNIDEHTITSYDAYHYIKKLEKFFMENINEEVNKIWEIEKIVLRERRNRQPKITDYVRRTITDNQ